MILILELFGINILLLIYLFSFMNKSKNTVTNILGLTPIGLGKLVIRIFKYIKIVNGYIKSNKFNENSLKMQQKLCTKRNKLEKLFQL